MAGTFSANHHNQKCTPSQFIETWERLGSPSLVAKELGASIRQVYSRRDRIQQEFGVDLRTWNDTSDRAVKIVKHQGKVEQSIDNGIVIVFSDAHFWPGFKTTANRALLAMIRQLNPVAVVCNGDAFDGATISRFPRPFYDEGKPTVAAELKAVDERLEEIYDASEHGNVAHIWCLGNHDLRYEHRLASVAPEYQGINGFHLKDRFPMWRPAWSFWINDEIEIRHRFRGGIHATHNNVMANHHTTITGHLHSLQVRPYTDGRGVIKYGVDVGTLADSDGPQFVDYMEGRQPNWRSGFAVLTFKNGELLMPELVMKHDEDHVQFRGHLLNADTGGIA